LTAAFGLLTAIVVALGAIAAWRAARRADRASLRAVTHMDAVGDRVAKVDRKVEQVHEVVNSRLTAMLLRTEAMVKILEKAGLPVPPARDKPAPEADPA
jgi:hypothetical protein